MGGEEGAETAWGKEKQREIKWGWGPISAVKTDRRAVVCAQKKAKSRCLKSRDTRVLCADTDLGQGKGHTL